MSGQVPSRKMLVIVRPSGEARTGLKMKRGPHMAKKWRTILGDGNACVVDLPNDFDLAKALKGAAEIRLATAFAHRSGWKNLSAAMSPRPSVSLLTGLDCFQTEPSVLKDWLDLKSAAPDRVKAKLASDQTFFHPKVLIVTSGPPLPDFAVVGSGNLSWGGLRTNTECSIYTENPNTLAELQEWFDHQFAVAVTLTDAIIDEYEKDYKKNRSRRAKLDQEQRRVGKKLVAIGQASMLYWKRGVREAEKYFQSDIFGHDYQVRSDGANQIRIVLNTPDFNFEKKGWAQFYSIKALGRLDPRHRDRVFAKAGRLRKGLRSMLKNGRSALPSVLNHGGRLAVPGLGLNTISKILVAHDPNAWAVYNARVARVLREFGYGAPRGAGAAERYLAYTDAMAQFRKGFGGRQIDSLALDAFFYHWSKKPKGD